MLKNIQALALKIITEDKSLEKEQNKLLKQSIQKKFKERVEI